MAEIDEGYLFARKDCIDRENPYWAVGLGSILIVPVPGSISLSDVMVHEVCLWV